MINVFKKRRRFFYNFYDTPFHIFYFPIYVFFLKNSIAYNSSLKKNIMYNEH